MFFGANWSSSSSKSWEVSDWFGCGAQKLSAIWYTSGCNFQITLYGMQLGEWSTGGDAEAEGEVPTCTDGSAVGQCADWLESEILHADLMARPLLEYFRSAFVYETKRDETRR